MNETEFTPRCLSGAAELEIDFYRDLYELGVWWALLSGHDRETRRTPRPRALPVQRRGVPRSVRPRGRQGRGGSST